MRTASAVEARLRRDRGGALIDYLLPQVSHVLSHASRSLAFAIGPAHQAAVFDRVEFIPLSSGRVLVVIIARGRRLKGSPFRFGAQRVKALAEPVHFTIS